MTFQANDAIAIVIVVILLGLVLASLLLWVDGVKKR